MLQTIGEQVEGLGGAAGKQDLRRVGRIQPACDLVTTAFEGAGRPLPRQMLGTVHVGRAAGVIAEQGIEHGLRLLRGGGAVQVGLAFAVESQDAGEVGAPGGCQRHMGLKAARSAEYCGRDFSRDFVAVIRG
ncbi:hypothetical protein D3C72_1847090 [compost metagenome]